MVGKNPVDKIIAEIDSSMALFTLMTSNVAYDNHTRDWVVFEIAVAKTRGIPVLCWMDENVAENKAFPKLIENITDYDTFNPVNDEECYRVVSAMVDKAFEFKGSAQKGSKPTEKELKEGLVQMKEAEKIAVEFVRKTKGPQNINVNSIEPKDNGWLLKGSASTSSKDGFYSEKWTITIDTNGKITSYKFEPGGFFLSVAETF